MLESLVALLLISFLVLAPLLWRVGRDRRVEEAQALEARLQSIVNQRLGGESYLHVMVEARRAGQRGGVSLVTPARYRWLVDEVWKDVRAAVPADYVLVVPGDAPVRAPMPGAIPARRAA